MFLSELLTIFVRNTDIMTGENKICENCKKAIAQNPLLILGLLPVLAENAKAQMQNAGVSDEQKQIFEQVMKGNVSYSSLMDFINTQNKG